ncbi:nadh-ubiquinone oxidoreductase sgdh subunit [Holotrichia oblita]|uniref:Nadh-ubiquinone oxidoreductase sgdh subunit n=1 Tax=Holotrichia oblita TaxID=644536 RepID=A0ACB9SW05_HOLOL|nr:nadh-ubiquinone oxidoreductase sgdh subunit [Holotrichia oblita]
MSDHRTFPYMPTRFQWLKFKDLMHLYISLGVIPLGLLTLYCNIFIGPATLAEIPEDYEPKHWEYYRHPISRFLARYLLPSPQQEYEKYLHHIYEEEEKKRIRHI